MEGENKGLIGIPLKFYIDFFVCMILDEKYHRTIWHQKSEFQLLQRLKISFLNLEVWVMILWCINI